MALKKNDRQWNWRIYGIKGVEKLIDWTDNVKKIETSKPSEADPHFNTSVGLIGRSI